MSATSPISRGRPAGDELEGQPPVGIDDLIADAEGLRQLLQGTSGQGVRLRAALWLQRRQSRAVQAVVAKLRQLHLGE